MERLPTRPEPVMANSEAVKSSSNSFMYSCSDCAETF